MQRTKIAIVGYTEHKNQAPFRNDDWEIWSLNDHYNDLRDWNIPLGRLRWFQLHRWAESLVPPLAGETPLAIAAEGPHHGRDPDHLGWMQKWSQLGLRLYIMRERPELPHAITYPRDAVLRYFDDGRGSPISYFTNSISWMIGLAIMELAPNGPGSVVPGAELAVFGVDMMMAGGQGSEYGYQRPSVEWVLGWARGLGIPIAIPRESDILKSAFNYGDEEHEYFRDRLMAYRKEMSRRRGIASNQIQEGQLAHAELSGAINTADWLLHAHMPGDPGDPGLGRVPEPNSQKTPLGETDQGVPIPINIE